MAIEYRLYRMVKGHQLQTGHDLLDDGCLCTREESWVTYLATQSAGLVGVPGMQKVGRIRKSSASYFGEVDKNRKYNSHILQAPRSSEADHNVTWS